MPSPAEILGPDGRIAARMASYEHRPQQLAMAEAVDETIRQGRHLIVEAGTGVGQSFAFPAPAIFGTPKGKAEEAPQRRGAVFNQNINRQSTRLYHPHVMTSHFASVMIKKHK